MKTSEILRRAGDISRRYGWNQYSRGEGATSSHCVIGSIEVARNGDLAMSVSEFNAYDTDELEPLRTVVGEHVDDWNDDLDRTHAEVLIALDAAYVLALQEEGLDPAEVLG